MFVEYTLAFLAFFISSTLATGKLFDNGQLGQVSGSQFGLAGTNATYDYVVVGGGTAGLTIATRLAEDPSVSVVVIEAGGFYELDNGNLSVIPGGATFYTGANATNYQPLIDWGFSTIPQAGANNRIIHYARGKTLGGSSARNYMLYHRPTIGSLQMWADQVGDDSYTWDQFLPYYKKSCNYTAFNPALYHNATNSQDPAAFDPSGGPLSVSFSNEVDSFGTWVQKGFEHVGMKLIPGLSSGALFGSAYGTLTVDPSNAYRSSSESSFLQAALQNGTAPTIYKNSFVQRILFDYDNTATGVLVQTASGYGTQSMNYTISARKEVIVSAGVFQSPQLLMVSGVGPANVLKNFSIPVIKDLPGVGQNMWDHILWGTDRKVNVLTTSASINNPSLAYAADQLFRENASGPLSIFGPGYFGFEDLPWPYRGNLSSASIAALNGNFSAAGDWPELEWLAVSAYLGYQEDRQTEDPRDGFNYATIITALVSPLSRGNLSLQSASMTDPPLINPNWLTDSTDQELAIQSLHRQRQIWSYLESQGLTVGDEALPGSNVTSDAAILNYIRQSLIQVYHAAATCKMGPANDSMAVIDNHARVYGTQNLRVVDASSFPFLPPGHPQATIYALAEKIAADVLGPATPGPGYDTNGDTSLPSRLN